MTIYLKNADLMTLKDGDFFEVINGRWYGRKVIKGDKHYIQMGEDGFRAIDENSKKTLNIVILEKDEQPRWMPF